MWEAEARSSLFPSTWSRFTEPRVVEIPPDLLAALEGDPEAMNSFGKLSYTHQKEYVRWVEEAKREQTRLNRVNKTIDLLKLGISRE